MSDNSLGPPVIKAARNPAARRISRNAFSAIRSTRSTVPIWPWRHCRRTARKATGGPSYGSWELIYARVGGVSVDSAPELSFGIALDNAIYTVNTMPPVSPATAAPLLTARLRLRNTAQPITLNFPSGQSFDFTITNDKGAIVYHWSDGQAFTTIFRTENFGPGEKDFVIQLRLNGPDKAPLPAGKYVAEGWLTSMGAKVFDASVPFQVVWLY